MNVYQYDYDAAWKKVIRENFSSFLKFFFYDIYNSIDFSKKFKFLDKELEKIYKKGGVGKKYPDLLIEVYLKNGETKLIIIHIEVQSYFNSKKEKEIFPERIYTYNYRGKDIFNKDVVSLVILLDTDPDYRADIYRKKYWGFEIIFKYPVVKILDYRGKEEELGDEDNPFGEVVISQLKSMEVKNKGEEERKLIKMSLIKRLYEKGLNRDEIISLFEFIDYVINLSKDVEEELMEEVNKYEEEVKNMEIVAPYKKILIEKGYREGIEKGIEKGILEDKYEVLSKIIAKRIRTLSKEEEDIIKRCKDIAKLDAAIDEALTSDSVEEILYVLE